jgi:hypothetical protein
MCGMGTMQLRLEKESEMNRKEWELRKEREKAQILMRPSAGLASPTSALAANPAEVKELKVLSTCLLASWTPGEIGLTTHIQRPPKRRWRSG